MAKKKDSAWIGNCERREAILEAALRATKRKNLVQRLGGMDVKFLPNPDEPDGAVVVAIRPKSMSLETWAQLDVSGVITKTFRSPLEFAVAWAKRGDWGCLADYIEVSRMGNKEMRTFVAGVLRQEIKKPQNRAARSRRIFGPGGVFERVRFLLSLSENGVGREAAIAMTAEKFDTDRRTIQRDLKEGEAAIRFWDSMAEFISRAEDNAPRYAVSNAALTPHFLS